MMGNVYFYSISFAENKSECCIFAQILKKNIKVCVES